MVQPGDVRAGENPINAIFDLAEDVNERLPKTRRIVRYARFFVWFWLLIDFLVLVVILSAPAVRVLGLLVLPLLVLLVVARGWTASATLRAILTSLAVIATRLPGTGLAVTALFLGPLLLGVFATGLAILERTRDLRREHPPRLIRVAAGSGRGAS
jgi:uncharacterized membrane protein